MNIKYKKFTIPLLVGLIVMFVGFTLCSFLCVNSASAVENITTTFTSNRYHDLIFTYYSGSESTGIVGINNYRAFWYIDFQVTDAGVSAFYYSLDTNFNSTGGSSEQGYIRKPLVLRSYSDTSTTEDYFIFTNSTSIGTSRYLDYVCQYELLGNVTTTLPTYYTVTYTSLDSVIWNFTAKNHGYNTRDNAYCVTTHTWGNDSYRISLSFVAQYTKDFYDLVATAPYSYTMYYSADNTGSNNSYQSGYDAGKLAGINQANQTVNTDSASYNAGYTAGLNDTNPFTFTNLFGSIADSQLAFVEGLLGFDFLGINVLGLFKVIITMGLVYGVFRLIKG